MLFPVKLKFLQGKIRPRFFNDNSTQCSSAVSLTMTVEERIKEQEARKPKETKCFGFEFVN